MSTRTRSTKSERSKMRFGRPQIALSGERTMVDESRPLLGQPTPCVGREREIAILSAAFEACVEQSEASGAVVIAPAGMGKSRLKHEFLRRLRGLVPDVQVLSGSGTPMSAGSPHGLLSEALWRLSGAHVEDPPALQEEKVRRCRRRDTARVRELARTWLDPVTQT
jgi:hypothetical protein